MRWSLIGLAVVGMSVAILTAGGCPAISAAGAVAAKDDAGTTATASLMIKTDPNSSGTPPPYFMSMHTDDVLSVNNPVSAHFMCDIYDPDHKVVSVTVDLAEAGGSNGTPMERTSDTNWCVRGDLLPIVAGTRSIVFHATGPGVNLTMPGTAEVHWAGSP